MASQDSSKTLNNRAPHPSIKYSLLLASTLTVMAGASVTAAVPRFQEVFAGSPNIELLSRLVLTLPALFIGLISPFSGYLIDNIGRKRVLVGGIVLYCIAGTSGLYLDSITAILAGRALLGIAVAGTMTAVTTLVGDYFEGVPRQKFVGLQGGIMALSGLVITTLGGGLADIFWRGPFLIYFLSLLYLPLIVRFVKEPTLDTHSSHSHTAGKHQESAGEGQQADRKRSEPAGKPDTKPDTAVQAPRRDYPRGTVFALYGITFLGMVLFFMMPTQVPDYVAEKTAVSNLLKGFAVGIGTLTGSVVSMNYQVIKRRLHFLGVFALFFCVTGAGFIALSLATTYPLILAGGLIAGLGAGLLMPNSNYWLVELAPNRLRGRLVGGLTMSIFLGQFSSPLIMTPLSGAIGGLSNTFLVAALFMLAAGAVFGLLEYRQRKLGLADTPGVPGIFSKGGGPATPQQSGDAPLAQAEDDDNPNEESLPLEEVKK